MSRTPDLKKLNRVERDRFVNQVIAAKRAEHARDLHIAVASMSPRELMNGMSRSPAAFDNPLRWPR